MVVLKELTVREAAPEEIDRVRALLGQEHYLGAGRGVGRTLVQVIHHQERWVAVVIWGPAAIVFGSNPALGGIGWPERG